MRHRRHHGAQASGGSVPVPDPPSGSERYRLTDIQRTQLRGPLPSERTNIRLGMPPNAERHPASALRYRRARTIHANEGATTPGRSRGPCSSDHPRECGVDTFPAGDAIASGSPPRRPVGARRDTEPLCHRLHRLPPAVQQQPPQIPGTLRPRVPPYQRREYLGSELLQPAPHRRKLPSSRTASELPHTRRGAKPTEARSSCRPGGDRADRQHGRPTPAGPRHQGRRGRLRPTPPPGPLGTPQRGAQGDSV